MVGVIVHVILVAGFVIVSVSVHVSLVAGIVSVIVSVIVILVAGVGIGIIIGVVGVGRRCPDIFRVVGIGIGVARTARQAAQTRDVAAPVAVQVVAAPFCKYFANANKQYNYNKYNHGC